MIRYTLLIACACLFSASWAYPVPTNSGFGVSQLADKQGVELQVETQGNKVLLSWDVLPQKQIQEIRIQRAVESNDYSTIHQEKSNVLTSDFVDYLLGSEVNASFISYKVVITFTDGSTIRSGAKTIDLDERRALKPTIFTNGNSIQFDFYSQVRSRINVQVFNSTSRLVKQQVLTTYQGQNELTVQADNLPSGMYFLRLEQNGKTTTTKFFVR